jgi:hypothetical protein
MSAAPAIKVVASSLVRHSALASAVVVCKTVGLLGGAAPEPPAIPRRWDKNSGHLLGRAGRALLPNPPDGKGS